MKGTGVGGDSCLYRIFLIGGFLTVIGGTVITALTQPPNSKLPIYVGVGTVAVFMVLIVGYWVVQIIFKGYGGMKAPDASQRRNVNDLSVLQNWDTLFNAMVTEGGDPEKLQLSAKRGNSNLIIWFLWAAVIALCPIAMMVPYAFGLIEWSSIRYAVLFYIGIVVFMSFLSFFLGGRAAKAGQEVVLEPLGLKITELPQIDMVGGNSQVRGRTVMEGIRFNRAVKIILDISNSITNIQYRSPVFVIKSNAGDLEVQAGAPASVQNSLRGLRKAKRWEGIEVLGGQNEIKVTRKDKGQNLWLYDLWLAERIINELEKGNI